MFELQKECGLEVIKGLVKGDKNVSRIFGFILYTDKDPYVAKVLRDDDFWKSLDSISGDNWPIFAVRPMGKGYYQYSGGGKNSIGFMVQTWVEPKDNLTILHDFGIKGTNELPLFVAFMWDYNDNLHEVTIPIEGKNTDEVYESLREIVDAITRVEAAIRPEYKQSENVFRNVESELKAIKAKRGFVKGTDIAKKFYDFFSVFL